MSIASIAKNANAKVPKNPAQARAQYSDVVKVFKDIERVANVGHDVHLKITKGGPTAATNCHDMITMSDSTIRNFLRRDVDYIALVIGHEFSHIIDQSCGGSDAAQRMNEKSADLHGQKLANKAGYNGCDGYKLFIDYNRIYGSDPEDREHPTPLQRAAYMKCGGAR